MTELDDLPEEGQTLEAWQDGAWRPGIVKRVKPRSKQAQMSLGTAAQTCWLPCDALRLPVIWNLGKWQATGETRAPAAQCVLRH